MFEIFKGNDTRYQEQYNHIREILLMESKVTLESPKATEYYIYWSRPEWQVQGGARLDFETGQGLYILKNITFHMDDELVEALEEVEEDQMYDTLIRQFYQDIYFKFREICKGHERLLVRLPALEIQDSMMLGKWEYLELEQSSDPNYLEGIVDISEVAEVMHLHNRYRMELSANLH